MMLKLLLSISSVGAIMAQSTLKADPKCWDEESAKGCHVFQMETDRFGWWGYHKANLTVTVYDEQYYKNVKNLEALNVTLLQVNASSQEKGMAAVKKVKELKAEVKGLKDLLLSKDQDIKDLTTTVETLINNQDVLFRAITALTTIVSDGLNATAAISEIGIHHLKMELKALKTEKELKLEDVQAFIAAFLDAKYEQQIWLLSCFLLSVFFAFKYWLARNGNLVSMFMLL